MYLRGTLTHVVPDADEVGELEVSVQVDLDDTVGDGGGVLLLGGARATVEDEEERLLLRSTNLLLGVGLVLAEELGVEFDVAGLVDTMDIAEASGNGEVGGRWGGKPARSARYPRAECREKRCQRRSCQHRPPRHPVCKR